MNSKQFKLLIIVSVVIVGIGVFLLVRDKGSWQQANKEIGGRVFADFPLNDIAAITIQTDTNEVEVAKNNDIWTVVDRDDYPASFSKISDLLRTVWELKELRRVPVGASQLASLELVEPGEGRDSGILLVFKDAAGQQQHTLLLGKQHMREAAASSSPFGGGGAFPDGRYLMPDGQTDRIALVQEPFSDVQTTAADWLQKDFFKVTKTQSIEVTTTNHSWKVERESESGDWKLTDLKDDEVLDTTKTSGFNYALSSPTFRDVAVGVASEDVGLATPKRIVMKTFEGFTYTIDAAQKDGDDFYYMTVDVEADLPSERTAGEDESEEDTERLDEEFAEAQSKLKEKLEQEQELEGWIYEVSNYTLSSVLKNRSDLLKTPEPEDEEVAGDAGIPFTDPVPVNGDQ